MEQMEWEEGGVLWLEDAVRATAERLSRDLAGDPKHIYCYDSIFHTHD